MEFLDEMPEDKKEHPLKKEDILPSEGFALELGSLNFTMSDIDLEIKDIKVRDLQEFRDFLMEVMEK